MTPFKIVCILLALECFIGGFIQGLNGSRFTPEVRSISNLITNGLAGLLFIIGLVVSIWDGFYIGILFLFIIYCLAGAAGMAISKSLRS